MSALTELKAKFNINYEEKTMSKSISYRVWNKIKDFDEGRKIKAQTVANALKIPDSIGAVTTAMEQMKRDGNLGKIKTGVFVITLMTHEWGINRRFCNLDANPNTAKVVHRKRVKKSAHPNRIIDNLLNAMAEAEGELRRLMELDEQVKQLGAKL